MLTIYNTLTQKKQPFVPIKPGKVSLYVCGMTVYDYCHVGHARGWIVFDIVARYLRFLNFDVTYVRNITDIDDKIIKRALENQETVTALTDRFIQALNEDNQALGVLPPDQEPRATQAIEHMIRLIQILIDKGFAYVSDNQDVLYDVNAFSGYGKLSHKKLADLQAGMRVAISDQKRNSLDFVLWKSAKPDEPSWDSPWGKGRPGWHIECSAMSMDALGEQFDIHGGGFDLQFPHHENEIAQSEAATGKPFVNTWMHVGFVNIDDEKMSKSLGNFFTVRDVLTVYSPEVVRYFLLSSHYRSPLNYSTEVLDNAKSALTRFYGALSDLKPTQNKQALGDYRARFTDKMNDDFNTPEALAVLFELAREINQVKTDDVTYANQLAGELCYLASFLGILQNDPVVFLQGDLIQLSTDEINALIEKRHVAREQKNWGEADQIRQTLKEAGIVLEDRAGKTTWRAV